MHKLQSYEKLKGTFISVFNQLDAQNVFHSKFYFMPLRVSSTCAHQQEVKIALHSLWYHHTCRCDEIKLIVKQILCIKLVKYWDKYTETHGQQNVKICERDMFGYKKEELIKPPEREKNHKKKTEFKLQAGNFIVYVECFISLCIFIWS